MEAQSDTAPDAQSARHTLVANEQIKYNATYINGIAIAVFAIGGVGPFVGSLTMGGSVFSASVFGVAAVCWIVSFVLHKSVLRLLKRLTA